MTTSDYLEQLQQDREDLIDNLEAKGITGLTGDETFTELVPEVLNIPSGGSVDWSNYYYDEITSNMSSSSNMSTKVIKDIPDDFFVTVSNSVTNLRYTYSGFTGEALPKLKFNNNVTNMESMFNNCMNIKKIDLSLTNTSNVTNMQYLFKKTNENGNLKQIIFGSNFSTQSVTTIEGMFHGNNGLTNLDLSMFETPNLINIRYMFYRCRSLSHVDIRKMTFDRITQSDHLLDGVATTCEIIVKDATAKTWFNTNYADYTNVKTVAEYETQ